MITKRFSIKSLSCYDIDFTDVRNAFVVLEDREDEAFNVMFFDFYLYGHKVNIYKSGAINPSLYWSAPLIQIGMNI